MAIQRQLNTAKTSVDFTNEVQRNSTIELNNQKRTHKRVSRTYLYTEKMYN